MKILLAVPTYESIFPDVYRALWKMDKGGHDVDFGVAMGYDVATARNKIVIAAQDRKCEYILMVDNDVVVPKDALVNMLEGNYDVVLGHYAHRYRDGRPYDGTTCLCKLMDKEGNPYLGYPEESLYKAKEFEAARQRGEIKMPIHGGGMGCALIKTSVFEQLEYPWYKWVLYNTEHRGMLSEDLYFCEQLRRRGITIYADTRVGCAHILRWPQWP